MYQPNFCSECGAKIVRLHWHPWTSRKFCDSCARFLRKQRLKLPLIVGAALVSIGLITGRATRMPPPPLVIERAANSPLYGSQKNMELEDPHSTSAKQSSSGASPVSTSSRSPAEEMVYICGARTQKGRPCSRRVRSMVRCWQHKGLPAILPPEKLVITADRETSRQASR